MIQCIIVEDEELAQDVIKSHLGSCPGFLLVGVYRSAAEALEALHDGTHVDLMFLDIRLPGGSGLYFLQSLPNPPQVILTTAYAEYALESYELNVVDYLLKPISLERFTRAIAKVTAKGPESDHVFVKVDGKFVKVNFRDILYVEGMRDYLKIHLQGRTLVTLQTMSELERALPRGQFIRVHKSYIVSVAHIGAVFGNSVEIGEGQKTVPIGLNYRDLVMSFIGRKAR